MRHTAANDAGERIELCAISVIAGLHRAIGNASSGPLTTAQTTRDAELIRH
jgi:hypothetical protein